MSLGALPHFIMDAGRSLAADGAGAQGRFMVALTMYRRSLATAAAGTSDLAFGFGGGFRGGVGWFPLGFHEPFHPWYHTSGNCTSAT